MSSGSSRQFTDRPCRARRAHRRFGSSSCASATVAARSVPIDVISNSPPRFCDRRRRTSSMIRPRITRGGVVHEPRAIGEDRPFLARDCEVGLVQQGRHPDGPARALARELAAGQPMELRVQSVEQGISGCTRSARPTGRSSVDCIEVLTRHRSAGDGTHRFLFYPDRPRLHASRPGAQARGRQPCVRSRRFAFLCASWGVKFEARCRTERPFTGDRNQMRKR